MFRLALFFFLLASVALAIASVMAMLRSMFIGPDPTQTERPNDTMPKTFRTVSYILLLLLMFGVSTGWLGGA
jgi:hypothetical protein